jgi:hypothetical protein
MRLFCRFDTVVKVFADGGYTGTLIDWAKAMFGYSIEVGWQDRRKPRTFSPKDNHMTLQELKQNQKASLTAAESLMKTAEDAGRGFTASENERYEAHMADYQSWAMQAKKIEMKNTISTLMNANGVPNAAHVLREAAEVYKVDVAAITATIKQEFAAKEKAKTAKKAAPKPPAKVPAKTAKRAAA